MKIIAYLTYRTLSGLHVFALYCVHIFDSEIIAASKTTLQWTWPIAPNRTHIFYNARFATARSSDPELRLTISPSYRTKINSVVCCDRMWSFNHNVVCALWDSMQGFCAEGGVGCNEMSTHVDSFTVPLHSPNGRPLGLRKGTVTAWGLKNNGNSHRSREPIMQWGARQSQSIFKPTNH